MKQAYRLFVTTLLLATLPFVTACGNTESSPTNGATADATSTTDTLTEGDVATEADTSAAPDQTTLPPDDGGPDTYVAGLAKVGEIYTVSLIESQPIPKDTGLYTWVVELSDAGGDPVIGATIVAEPTMPDHGHGTFPPTTEAIALETPGHYELTDMDLFMPGVWQVEIFIDVDDDSDGVIYNFDLEG